MLSCQKSALYQETGKKDFPIHIVVLKPLLLSTLSCFYSLPRTLPQFTFQPEAKVSISWCCACAIISAQVLFVFLCNIHSKQVFLPREFLKPFMLIKISENDCQKWGNWVLKRHLTIFSFAIKRKSRKRERFVEISANTYFRLWSESLSKVNISICKIQQRKERQVSLLSCQILHQLQYSRYKSLSTDFLISSQHNRLQSYHNMKAVTV